jgi:hypothetical protein
MKTVKFLLLSGLLLFSRGCDFYSTSLWIFQENGLEGEMNPLTQLFGVGWNGLIIANVIVIALVLLLLAKYYFRHSVPKEFSPVPSNFKEMISIWYFDRPDQFYRLFYRMPINRPVSLAHAGYVLTITIIIGSFLATIHNLCQFYQVPFYDTFRNWVGRPLFVIYGLILLTIFISSYLLFKREYRTYLAHNQS